MDQWLSSFTNKHLDFEKNKLADRVWEDGWTKKKLQVDCPLPGLQVDRQIEREGMEDSPSCKALKGEQVPQPNMAMESINMGMDAMDAANQPG